MKVLITEDNLDIASTYKEVLAKNGIDSDIALTANAALERLKMFEYHFIILDLNLPDIYGIDLLQEIKKDFPYIPVIVATARDEDDLIVKALNLGADDYLKKPINYDELVARIKAVYNRIKSRPNKNLILNPINVDLESKQVLIDEKEVLLTQDEFLILTTLMENYPKSLSLDELLKIVTEYSPTKDISSLRVNIHNLTRKLNKSYKFDLLTNDEEGYKICLEQ